MGLLQTHPNLGGEHIKVLNNQVCDLPTCPNTVLYPNGHWAHKEKLGGNDMRSSRDQKYRVPEDLIRYLLTDPVNYEIDEVVEGLHRLRLRALPELQFEDDFSNETLK